MIRQVSFSAARQLLQKELSNQRPIITGIALRLAAAAATFAATFVVARFYGAAITGEYALFTQTVVAFSLIAIFGNEKLLVRRMAGSLADERKDLARLSYTHAMRQVGLAALGVAALMLALSLLADVIGIAAPLLVIAAPAILLYSLTQVASAAMRGAHHLVTSQALLALHPALFVLLIPLVVLSWNGPAAIGLALAYLVAALVAGALAILFVRHHLRGWPVAEQKHPDDGRTNSMLLGLTIAVDTAAGWVMLGLTAILLGLADTGVFRVCVQFMTVVAMIVTTYNGMISPHFAHLFRKGDLAGARRAHNRSIAVLLLLVGMPLLAIAIFAEPLLRLMGEEFREGTTALRILAVGQIAAMTSGGAGAMISMNGHEAYSLKLALFSFAVVIAAMLLLTPIMGIDGAAFSLALMWVIRQVGSLIYARRMVATQA
jgi:O-antigen/teichoic acid export membrane protein